MGRLERCTPQKLTMNPQDLAHLIRARRSSLLIDAQREVPREIVEELCELLTWAPNHKRTWPWNIGHGIQDVFSMGCERFIQVIDITGTEGALPRLPKFGELVAHHLLG